MVPYSSISNEPLLRRDGTTLATPSKIHRAGSHGLNGFGLGDMIECGRAIRDLAQASSSMEEAARLLVSYFHRTLAAKSSGQPDCALVRCFKTHPLKELPLNLQEKAHAVMQRRGASPADDLPCLTLIASAGDQAAWNGRSNSATHGVIPLESIEVIERAPMISQLLRQMGLETGAVLAPTEELLLQADERAYGVFHVADAVGSPFIPAQEDFVLKFGIKSVLGFGGLLPSGELFAMIMFSRTFISRETANLFRTLALSVKLVLLPFTRGPIFAEETRIDRRPAERSQEQEQMRSEIATLRLLLPALEEAAMSQTNRLERVVTDLRLQAEEVERLDARLSSTLEATTDAVFLLDELWRFTYLNHHAMDLLQADSELLGKNIWDEFPAAVGRNFWHKYHKAMQDRVQVQFEEYYPEPLDRWFEVQAFPSDLGIAVFFHDITDRNRANDALIKSEKLAVVGRLAASIAHEINNPLESVTNLLYLAGASADMAEVKDYLATADRELRRAGAITSQTLRFHKQSSSPTEVTCAELIGDVLSIYHGRLVNSHVQVQERNRGAEKVRCFEGEIRQVLNNLVGNAIDAMHPDGGRLLLRSRVATDWATGRRGLAIAVADTGPGMSAHTITKAFEPFFTTKGIAGTGLGLWISREIITRHQGRLTLRSSHTAGRSGTVVALFLPFDAAAR